MKNVSYLTDLSTGNLGCGVQREWGEYGICLYTVNQNGQDYRACVDTWLNAVLEFDRRWPLEQPHLVLHDIRELSFSHYAVWRATQLAKEAPYRQRGYEALVIKPNTTGTMALFAINKVIAPFIGTIEVQSFFDYNEAFKWLKQMAVRQ